MALMRDIMDALGEIFPWALSEEADASGLLVGSLEADVRRVICSLDLAGDVLDASVESGCELLIVHHPQLLVGLDTVWDFKTPAGALARRSALAGLNIVACHTNADASENGAAALTATYLRLRAQGPLEASGGVYLAKVAVFVPPEALEEVQAAMADAGAGVIGDYTHCGFRVRGKGTFLPGADTRPYSGEVGALNLVDEVRLEMLVPSFRVPAVIAGMLSRHPYEEVAYDIYRTENPVPWGLGRIGMLPEPRTLSDITEDLSRWCGAGNAALLGDPERRITRTAVMTGDSNRAVTRAYRMGAELLIAGEVGWQKAREAREAGMSLLCLGYEESERILVERTVERMNEASARRGLGISVEGFGIHEGRRR